MSDYGDFARFYDALMGDAQHNSLRVLAAIERYLPQASSLLELGCGTGSVLAGLTTLVSLSGLDRSPEMLAIARSKVPSARYVEGDMASFDLDHRFDVVICMFDTVNHLANFDQWRALFRRVYHHLADEGLFVFDVNTIGRLRRLGDDPPWVYDLKGHTIIMNVDRGEDELSTWHVRIFEHVGGTRFTLHHERIEELGVELDQIKSSLALWFDLLEETDPQGEKPNDESLRAHFVARRRREPGGG
jgi:SAM-dependent methyltransferase